MLLFLVDGFSYCGSSPTGIYLFKVSNGNTRLMSEIYSKLTIKTPDIVDVVLVSFLLKDFIPCSGVSIVDFEKVNAGWIIFTQYLIF